MRRSSLFFTRKQKTEGPDGPAIRYIFTISAPLPSPKELLYLHDLSQFPLEVPPYFEKLNGGTDVPFISY